MRPSHLFGRVDLLQGNDSKILLCTRLLAGSLKLTTDVFNSLSVRIRTIRPLKGITVDVT